MTNHELEQKIRTAAEHAAPDQLDSILSSCDDLQKAESPFSTEREQKKGDIIYMSEKKKSGAGRKGVMAAVAALVLILAAGVFGGMRSNMVRPVDSVVILDVNPSISLSVDAKEKVLAVEALNEDARDVLGSMELKGTSLEVAVNAVIGAMLQKGYLGDLQNSILVSVENADAAKGEQLQKKVSQAIENAVHTDTLDAAVLSQVVDADDAQLAATAEQYGISMGKAALIQEVIAQVPALTFDSLAPMSINEIALIASSKNVSSETVQQSGVASDKSYIGREEALEKACAHAGIAVSEAQRVEIEFDSEKGVMVYEVEFEDGSNEYEYDINAVTGAVTKFEIEPKRGNAASSAGSSVKAENGGKTEANAAENGGRTEANAAENGGKTEVNAAGNSGRTENSGSDAAKTGNLSDGADRTQQSALSYIGEDAAAAAALSHAGIAESDAVYVHSYLEYDDGRPEHYEVDFLVGNTEYEYEIDLYTGSVLKYDMDTNYEHYGEGHSGTNASGAAQSADSGYIGETAALEAALKHAGVAENTLSKKKIKLDRENGRMIYEVEFEVGRSEYEYEIDALSGDILKSEIDLD